MSGRTERSALRNIGNSIATESCDNRPVMRILLLVVVALGTLLAPARADEAAQLFDPRFREGAPSDLLVEGPPRLSRGHVHGFLDTFEAAFDVALSAEVEQHLRAALEKRFATTGPRERERFLDLADGIVELRRCARCCNSAAVRRCLRAFRCELDRRLVAAPEDPVHRVLLHVLERRHVVTWLGRPEVKALAADAYLEAVQFVASLGRNEAIRLSPGQQTALRDYLERDLRRLSESVRTRIGCTHRIWLQAKARWDRAKDGRRLSMRWEAVRLMARLVPKTGGHTVEDGPDLTSYAREARRVAAADRGYDAITALARNPQLLFHALQRGLDLDADVQAFTFMYR